MAWLAATAGHATVNGDGPLSSPAFKKPYFFVLDQAEEFMEYLRDGWHIEVLCRSDAYLRNSYWYGEWVVLLVAPDESQEVPLLKSRRGGQIADDMRVFKTVNGIYSFCKQYGVHTPGIPSVEGDRERQRVTLPD